MSVIEWSDVKQWTISPWQELYEDLEKEEGNYSSAIDEVREMANSAQSRGLAADAAYGELQNYQDQLTIHQVHLNKTAKSVLNFIGEVRKVVSDVDDVHNDAYVEKFSIDTDGGIRPSESRIRSALQECGVPVAFLDELVSHHSARTATDWLFRSGGAVFIEELRSFLLASPLLHLTLFDLLISGQIYIASLPAEIISSAISGNEVSGFKDPRVLTEGVSALIDSVTSTPWTVMVSRVVEIDTVVKRALTTGTQADKDFSLRLKESFATISADEAERYFVNEKILQPMDLENLSVMEAATWWNGLTKGEKNRWIYEHPEIICNLDGVDAVSRDEVGRIYLDAMIQYYNSNGDPNGILDHLYAIEISLQLEPAEDRMLLGLKIDPEALPFGRVLAAVSVGNPDTANSVAMFVPGTTATVAGSIVSSAHDMNGLRNGIARSNHSSRKNVAAISYFGYETPDWAVGSVTSPELARDGGRSLASFAEGLQYSRQASGQNNAYLTVIGHSYGGLTVGAAAAQVKHGVINNVVTAAPAGAGVDRISDYHISGGVYTAGAETNDIVPGIGQAVSGFGETPSKMDGVEVISSGGDPSVPPKGLGGKINPIGAHSDYFYEDPKGDYPGGTFMKDACDIAAARKVNN